MPEGPNDQCRPVDTIEPVTVTNQAPANAIVIDRDIGKPMETAASIDADDGKPAQRRGFLRGQFQSPEDFDTMFAAEIEAMFYGED